MNDDAGNEKVRSLVVEDEWAARNYLVELLNGSDLARVTGAVASVEEARKLLVGDRCSSFDVVFLDIRLAGDENGGLNLARELSALVHPPVLVLATAFDAHALDAYELGVADYLLKPFTEERVEQCLRRLQVRYHLSKPAGPLRIVARRERSLVFFEAAEVWAFEAVERTTRVHTAEGIFDLDLSLATIEASSGRALVRVHRNWLVNLTHIKELGREGNEGRVFVGEGLGAQRRGVYVPVARGRSHPLRELLLAGATGLRR